MGACESVAEEEIEEVKTMSPAYQLSSSSAQVLALLKDLRLAGVDVVTFGQYLRPSRRHMPVHSSATISVRRVDFFFFFSIG